MSEPTVAVALLQVFCRDEALVGDILEEYEFRRSRAWLWRQVGVAAIFSLPYGMVRPARYAPKMQMPIGGLGFVTIVALITIVAPGAWWFVAAGAMGGIALAVALVMSTRHRVMHEPMVRGHVLLPFLVLLIGVGAASRSNAQTLEPAVAVDPVDGIVDAFNTHKVVMLPGGHGSKPAHNLLMKILR